MSSAWKSRRAGNKEGFSLAESAISLAVVGLVLGALVPSFLTLQAGQQARTTRETLETIMRASAAYVQANGCFPCPTPPEKIGVAGFGVVRGDTSNPVPACAACPKAVGVVPFRSLGLPQSMARDGYGRYLTFAVDTNLTRAGLSETLCKGSPSGDCTQPDIDDKKRKAGLCAKAAFNSAFVLKVKPLDAPAAVLILSHGPNRRGVYKEEVDIPTSPRATFSTVACNMTAAPMTGLERCNVDDDLNFLETIAVQGSDPFDDQLLYFSRNAVMTMVGGAACNTEWP